jgi:hypothetical protein
MAINPIEQIAPRATCPLCHTPDHLLSDALPADERWQCSRCGHVWTTVRLATAAAYAAWAEAR